MVSAFEQDPWAIASQLSERSCPMISLHIPPPSSNKPESDATIFFPCMPLVVTQEHPGCWIDDRLLYIHHRWNLIDRPWLWISNLRRNGVEPEMYLPRAWLGLFTSWLPLATRASRIQLEWADGLSWFVLTTVSKALTFI